jgi:hypothetical protein
VHERVRVSRKTKRFIARATWPTDADPKGRLRFNFVKGELRVTEQGCDERVKIVE